MKTHFLLLALLLLPGCATRPCCDYVIGPSYRPTNIYGADSPLPANLRRVAILPLRLDAETSELEAGQTMLDPVLKDELAKAGRFEVVRVSPEELQAWTERKNWSTAELLPTNLLTQLREQRGCDAVLFAELTRFHAYPPLVIGWNLKLVESTSGQILWAADEVFDAGQEAVANGARRYSWHHSYLCGAPSDPRFILLSPTSFGHYSAETLLATIAPR
jgi:hypothetical protein